MPEHPAIQVVAFDDLEPRTHRSGLELAPVFETADATLAVTRLAVDERTDPFDVGDHPAYGAVVDGSVGIDTGPHDETVVVEREECFVVPPGLTVRLQAGPGGFDGLVALVGPGPTGPTPRDPPTSPQEPDLRVASEDELVLADSLANLTRKTPFPEAPVRQIRGHADGRVASEWHHHGDNDVFGYVLGGEGYVVWGPTEDDRVLAREGDCFYVPAGTVHRDVNPTDDEQDYLLWLTGSQPRTVRVDGPA